MTLNEAYNHLGVTLGILDYAYIQQAYYSNINKVDSVNLNDAFEEIKKHIYGMLNLSLDQKDIDSNLAKNYRDAMKKTRAGNIIDQNAISQLNQAKDFITSCEESKKNTPFQTAFLTTDINTLLQFARDGWVNQRGLSKQTIAHIVANRGTEANIQTLKDLLADFNLRDSAGLPPICYAKKDNIYALILAGSQLNMQVPNSSGATMSVYSYLVQNQMATLNELISGELDKKEAADAMLIAQLLGEGKKQGIDLFNTQGYAHKWTPGHVIATKLNQSQQLNNNGADLSNDQEAWFSWLIECDPTIRCPIEETKLIAPSNGLEQIATKIEKKAINFVAHMSAEVRHKYTQYIHKNISVYKKNLNKFLHNYAGCLNNISFSQTSYNLQRINSLLGVGADYQSTNQKGESPIDIIANFFIDAIDDNKKPDIAILYRILSSYNKISITHITMFINNFWLNFCDKLNLNSDKAKVRRGLISLLMCIEINEINSWDKNQLKPKIYSILNSILKNTEGVVTRSEWAIEHALARVGDIAYIKTLSQHKDKIYNFNLKTTSGQVPLSFSPNIETTLELVRAGADLNKIISINDPKTNLPINVKVVDLLLQKQNDNGKCELANRLLPILLDDINFLCKPDIIDALSPFWTNKGQAQAEKSKLKLIDHYARSCRVEEVVGKNNNITIISLLEDGASVDEWPVFGDGGFQLCKPQYVPFYKVLIERRNDILSYLIDSLQDIAKINLILSYKSCYNNIQSQKIGLTLMHLAVQAGDQKWISRLISDKADIERKTTHEGMTPIFFAPNLDIILSLKNRANLLAINNNNETALHYLYKNNKLSVSSLIDLCENKSDLDRYLSEIIAIAGNDNLLEERGTENKKTILEMAASYGTLEHIKNIINTGGDGKKENLDQTTLLHHVASCRNREMDLTITIIDYFVNTMKIDLWAENSDKLTALAVALRNFDAKAISAFLTFYLMNGIEIDHQFLLFEVAANRIWATAETKSIIALLTQFGANINKVNENGCTPMQIAAQYARIETIKALIESGANKCQPNRKETLLHYVALNQTRTIQQNKEVIQFLLTNNIDINAVDDNGLTALHKSIQYGNSEVITIFDEFSNSNVPRPPDERTLYHIAAMNNKRNYDEHLNVFNTILAIERKKGKKVKKIFTDRGELDIRETYMNLDKSGESFLYMAAQYSNLAGIKMYWEKSLLYWDHCNPNFFDYLLENKILRDEDIVSFFNYIFDNEKKINTHNLQSFSSILDFAAQKGRAQLIAYLLTNASQLKWNEDFKDNLNNKKLNKPLQLALQFGNAQTIDTLIEYGAEIQIVSDTKKNVLHLIAYNPALSTEQAHRIIEKFLAKGININAQDSLKCSPLQIAAHKGNAIMIEALITHGGDITVKLEPNQANLFHLISQNTVLSRNEAEKIILLLQARGLDIHVKNKHTYSPLHLAAEYGTPSTFEAILHHGGNLEEYIISCDSVFHLIARNKSRSIEQCREMIGLCLKHETADINIKNEAQWTPLHTAARHGNRLVMKALVENGAKIEKFIDKTSTLDGVNLLHLAALNHTRSQQECEDIILLCLDWGIKLDEKNETGWSALHYATRFGNDAMICALKKYHAKVEASPDGNTLIHLAINNTERSTEAQKSILMTLINRDFAIDVDEKNDEGLTAIHIALLKNTYEVVKLLMEAGANINGLTSDKRFYLMLAMQNPNTKMVSTLLSERALTKFDCIRQDAKGQNLLHYAILKNDIAILALLKNKAGTFFAEMIKAKNAEGKTPCQVAVDKTCQVSITWLKKAGFVVDAMNIIDEDEAKEKIPAHFGTLLKNNGKFSNSNNNNEKPVSEDLNNHDKPDFNNSQDQKRRKFS